MDERIDIEEAERIGELHYACCTVRKAVESGGVAEVVAMLGDKAGRQIAETMKWN